jgi:hypothetical protein
MIAAFPLDELSAYQDYPNYMRLRAAVERARAAAAAIERSRPAWARIASALDTAAGELQEKMLDYFRVSQIEGGSLFADFLNPPTSTAALKDAVRTALEDAVKEPLTTLLAGFAALAPYVRMLSDGLSRLLGTVHDKINSIAGSQGLGGIARAVEDAANLIRNFDLQPIREPLDAVYSRIETTVNSLDPSPLRGALNAVRQAVLELLNVATLFTPADGQALDTAWNQAVTTIGSLAPSRIISSTLDPEYEHLLSEFLPVLDMPGQLRAAIESTGRKLLDDAPRELARVEEAFDRMLHALRLDDTGSPSASVSVHASATVGG